MPKSKGSPGRPSLRSSPRPPPTLVDRLRSLADRVTGAFVRKRSNERPVGPPRSSIQTRRGPAGQKFEVVDPSSMSTPRNSPSPRQLQSPRPGYWPIPGPNIVGPPTIALEGPVPTRAEVVRSRGAHDEWLKRRGLDLISLRKMKYEEAVAEQEKAEDQYLPQMEMNSDLFGEIEIPWELEQAADNVEKTWKEYGDALHYKTVTALLAAHCNMEERETGEPLMRRPFHFREPGIPFDRYKDSEEIYGMKVIRMGYDPFIPRETEKEYKERLKIEEKRAEEEGARMHAEAEGARIRRDLRSRDKR